MKNKNKTSVGFKIREYDPEKDNAGELLEIKLKKIKRQKINIGNMVHGWSWSKHADFQTRKGRLSKRNVEKLGAEFIEPTKEKMSIKKFLLHTLYCFIAGYFVYYVISAMTFIVTRVLN